MVSLFNKEEENQEIENFKKFDFKKSPRKKKKKDIKKTLDNLFLQRERKIKKSPFEEDVDKPKVNLLSKSAFLDFKLNIKNK